MKSKKNKQKIGFTTMRIEDGLRCDPCSCFYIDKNDYLKHVAKYHKNMKQPLLNGRKRRKACTSCCDHCDCTGVHLPLEILKLQKRTSKKRKTSLRVNIKSRWTEISERLASKVKKEIDSDTEPLNKDDNVQIKTESERYIDIKSEGEKKETS